MTQESLEQNRRDYQEALTKAWEILDEIGQEEAKATEARGQYNALRSQSPVPELEAKASAEIAAKREELNVGLQQELDKVESQFKRAEDQYSRALATAEDKFGAAQASRDKDVQELGDSNKTILEGYTRQRLAELNEQKQGFESELAAIEMEDHNHKQRALSLRNSLERHCDNFKAQRGKDLRPALEAMKE